MSYYQTDPSTTGTYLAILPSVRYYYLILPSIILTPLGALTANVYPRALLSFSCSFQKRFYVKPLGY